MLGQIVINMLFFELENFRRNLLVRASELIDSWQWLNLFIWLAINIKLPILSHISVSKPHYSKHLDGRDLIAQVSFKGVEYHFAHDLNLNDSK